MRRSVEEYLQDILQASRNARRFVEGLTYEQFESDIEKVYAVSRALESIGEAVKKIPAPLRKRYPQIDWRSVARMRDVLIHGYFHIELRRVWQVIQQDLTPLEAAVSEILREVRESRGGSDEEQ
jgi:uncharacterized protein with HEPN domain